MIMPHVLTFSLNLTISTGGIAGAQGEGTGFSKNGFQPFNFLMKHAPGILRNSVTLPITPGVERFMDGILVGDETKYKSGTMVMSAKDGLGVGLFFWGAKGAYEDIRPIVPYLADEELAAKTSIIVRKYLTKWAEL